MHYLIEGGKGRPLGRDHFKTKLEQWDGTGNALILGQIIPGRRMATAKSWGASKSPNIREAKVITLKQG